MLAQVRYRNSARGTAEKADRLSGQVLIAVYTFRLILMEVYKFILNRISPLVLKGLHIHTKQSTNAYFVLESRRGKS
jgi:hypothetical protein